MPAPARPAPARSWYVSTVDEDGDDLERLAACSCNTAVSLSVVGALVRVDKGALIVVLLVPVDYCAGWSWRFCVKGRRKESIMLV